MSLRNAIEGSTSCILCGKRPDTGKNLCRACKTLSDGRKNNPPKIRKEPFTSEETKEIKNLYRKFWSINKIAKKFKTDRRSIYKALEKE